MASQIKFACFSPHPPLLLPHTGEEKNKEKVKETIGSLGLLAGALKQASPQILIISSPHPDWGFNVPLHFLAKDFRGEIKPYLIGLEPTETYFGRGKDVFQTKIKEKTVGLIASGDLSHCLKTDGPYGFHPDGPKFDKALVNCLKEKDVQTILQLDTLYPQAGECGLRSFCFLLGILEGQKEKNKAFDWQANILSYQSPFGVGYLTVNFNLCSSPSKTKQEKI